MNLACLLLLMSLCWFQHRALVEHPALVDSSSVSAKPHLQAARARLATLGFYEVAADRGYIAFINYFGDKKMHRLNYPEVFPLLSQILALDPLFLTAYRYAGVLMSLEDADWRVAVRLHEQGERMRPDAWEVFFLRATAAMTIENKISLAAEHMSRAALLRGAPAYLRPLAVRLATSGGHPDVALDLVNVLLEQAQDEGSRAVLLARRDQVLYEQSLLRINRAAAVFKEKEKRSPRSVSELNEAKLYFGSRLDPWGAHLTFDEEGQATSLNSEKRLRIYKAPVETNTSSSLGLAPP